MAQTHLYWFPITLDCVQDVTLPRTLLFCLSPGLTDKFLCPCSFQFHTRPLVVRNLGTRVLLVSSASSITYFCDDGRFILCVFCPKCLSVSYVLELLQELQVLITLSVQNSTWHRVSPYPSLAGIWGCIWPPLAPASFTSRCVSSYWD